VADREANVVTDDGAAEAQQPDKPDVEPPGARVDGCEDQHGLARDGDAEVLH
jgi:hypothetical protein